MEKRQIQCMRNLRTYFKADADTAPCVLQLHLFAHLASLPKPLVDSSSLLSLLQNSFVSVLENEPGLRAERGDELVRVVLETLIRLSSDNGLNADSLEGIKSGIQGYMTSRQLDIAFLSSGTGNETQWIDVSFLPFS